MRTFSKTVEFYQTVDLKTFTDQEAAKKQEDKISQELKQKGLDLRQYVLQGETWGSFMIDKRSTLGVFTVIGVQKDKITVLDHNEKVHEANFENWNKQYLHQILNMIEEFRGA